MAMSPSFEFIFHCIYVLRKGVTVSCFGTVLAFSMKVAMMGMMMVVTRTNTPKMIMQAGHDM